MNKFFISTTIPYVNGNAHIGHAQEFVEADVIARLHRTYGEDVFFLTGTDENSLKNVLSAEKAGVPVQKFVHEYAERFRDLADNLNISYDDFIRTTEERHIRGAQKLWAACDAAGDIYKKNYRGLYCVGCELFVLGKDLENGLCPEHKTKPEVVEEENYFFRLSKYGKELERLITSGELKIIPEKRAHEMLSFIREGLEDFSISRSNERAKHWGVSVPGDSSQKMYVWFDALSNYINAVGYADNQREFKTWWGKSNTVTQFFGQFFVEMKRAEESLWPFWINPFVRLLGVKQSVITHILGKGVARFHVLYWPAMLLSAGIRLPREEFIHGYFTIDGQKMSKSLGNVVNPADLVKKYGTDAVRYFLLRGISAYEDGDFSIARFEELYNADLANGLGNFVQRLTTLAEKAGIANGDLSEEVFGEDIRRVKEKIKETLSRYAFHEAISALWELVAAGDRYINDTKVWGKEGSEQKKILGNLCSLALNIANILHIFLPQTAEEILRRFGLMIAEVRTAEGGKLSIKKGEPLFRRLG